MRKIISIVIILVFLAIDWLIFHDFLKRETYTLAEYLTGTISIPTILLLLIDIFKK